MKVYSKDLRKKVLKAYHDNEGSMRKIANRFMVSLTFVFNLLKRFKKNGHIEPKAHGGGMRSAIDYEGCQYLSELISQHTDLTLKELCEHYEEKFGKIVSKSAMDRTLKKMKITRKKKVLYDPEKDSDRVKNLTIEYIEKIKLENPKKFVFIDETGATLNMTLPYGRSLKGERVVGSRPVSSGQRISTITALTSEGVTACMSFEGTLNGSTFLFYMSNVLSPAIKEGQIVIMDNATAHKVKGVKELIENKRAKLVYLPPYSPNLSPVEPCWSKFKQILKKAKARTKEALNEAISKALSMITENDSKGWFEYCGYVI